MAQLRGAHRAMVASVLQNLGHPVPSDNEMDKLLHEAFTKIKKDHGINPDHVNYKFSLVEIDKGWVEQTFGKVEPNSSRWNSNK